MSGFSNGVVLFSWSKLHEESRLNISVKGDYALRALFDLATQPAGKPVKIADIARRHSIPQKFLELILASLKQAGFVESRRGADGGYLLTRPADELTVGEVLQFVEGRGSERVRKKSSDSPFSELWAQVDGAVSDILDSTTFAQLVRKWNEQHTRFVPNWEI